MAQVSYDMGSALESAEEDLILGDGRQVTPKFPRKRILAIAVSAVSAVACVAVAMTSWQPAAAPMKTHSINATSELSIHYTEQLKTDCDKVYQICSTPGTQPLDCANHIRSFLEGLFGTVTEKQVEQFHDRLQTDGGCHKQPRCSADHGAWVGGETCCNQPGTVQRESEICPLASPNCVGFVQGSPPTLGTCLHSPREVTQWPTGETLTCKNTPGWGNGYEKCAHEMDHPNPTICTASGWTCAAYLKNRWCENGKGAVWHGANTPVGPTMNWPEHNCCGCGGGSRTGVAPVPTALAAAAPAAVAPAAAASPVVAGLAPAVAGVAPAAPVVQPAIQIVQATPGLVPASR